MPLECRKRPCEILHGVALRGKDRPPRQSIVDIAAGRLVGKRVERYGNTILFVRLAPNDSITTRLKTIPANVEIAGNDLAAIETLPLF